MERMSPVETTTNDLITIARREHGYCGIYGITITQNGKVIFITDPNNCLFKDNLSARLVKRKPVKNALSAPIKVYFDPSDVCPCHCDHCLSNSGSYDNHQLNLEQAMNICQQIIDIGALQVKIGGGEPFVYPHFWEIIKILKKAGIFVSTSTSGATIHTLTDDQIKFLKEMAVKVSVSIDGGPDFHDQLRHFPELYSQAIWTIERLKAAGIRTEVSATIMNLPESIAQLNHLTMLAEKYQIPVGISLAKPAGRAIENNVAFIGRSPIYYQLAQRLRDLIKSNLLISSLISVEEVIGYDIPFSDGINFGPDCGAGTRSLSIDCFGNVRPCNFLGYLLPGENIFQSNLAEIWEKGADFLKIRQHFQQLKEAQCGNCPYVANCRGGCTSVRAYMPEDLQPIVDPRCLL